MFGELPRVIRWALIGVGALVLCSDIAQDVNWFGQAQTQQSWLLAATVVRNALLLVGLLGLILNKRWGYVVLLLSVGLGLVRRALFIQPLTTLSPGDPTMMAFHSGADLVFRLLALAVVVDYLRRER